MAFAVTPTPESSKPPVHWGKAIVIVALSVVGLFMVSVVGLTAKYWWQLRSGVAPAIVADWQNQFTASLPTQTNQSLDRAKLERGDAPFLGRPTAPITIVEFVDFKCPNCLAAAPIITQVAAKYGYGVKIIMRDFPAESLHPGATALARIGRCAFLQDRYWLVHDYFFSVQDQLPEVLAEQDVETIANQTGLDYPKLRTCLAGTAVDESVRRDYLEGAGYGVNGTPTFFINGQKVAGVVPMAVWDRILSTVK